MTSDIDVKWPGIDHRLCHCGRCCWRSCHRNASFTPYVVGPLGRGARLSVLARGAAIRLVVSRLTDVIIVGEFRWRPTDRANDDDVSVTSNWMIDDGAAWRQPTDSLAAPPPWRPTIYRLSPGRPRTQLQQQQQQRRLSSERLSQYCAVMLLRVNVMSVSSLASPGLAHNTPTLRHIQ